MSNNDQSIIIIRANFLTFIIIIIIIFIKKIKQTKIILVTPSFYSINYSYNLITFHIKILYFFIEMHRYDGFSHDNCYRLQSTPPRYSSFLYLFFLLYFRSSVTSHSTHMYTHTVMEITLL